MSLWAMVHKLREAMGQRDDLYTLEGMIETDLGYFTVEASTVEQEAQKAGRESVNHSRCYKRSSNVGAGTWGIMGNKLTFENYKCDTYLDTGLDRKRRWLLFLSSQI